MEMPKWEDIEKIGLGLGALLAGIWGGLKLAVRAQVKKHSSSVTITDDLQRKITRKEWHDLSNRIDTHGRKLALHKRRLALLLIACEENDEKLTKLQHEHESHVKTLGDLSHTIGRIDERLEGMKELQELTQRQAEEARREVLRRLDLRVVPREQGS